MVFVPGGLEWIFIFFLMGFSPAMVMLLLLSIY